MIALNYKHFTSNTCEEYALFGGGFNPIGLHHEEIADLIFEEIGIKTFMMPCYSHLFDKNSELAEPIDRLSMVALSSKKSIVPFSYEIQQKHNGSMYQTVEKLNQRLPNVVFYIVIGMDNANIMEEKWMHGKELIEENPFIVLHRKGVEPATDWFLKPPHRVLETNNDCSSTEIRKAIQNGDYEFVEQNLNPEVWKYIKEKKLYGYLG